MHKYNNAVAVVKIKLQPAAEVRQLFSTYIDDLNGITHYKLLTYCSLSERSQLVHR